MASWAKAREFVFREARLLERRLFSTLYEDAPARGVVHAVRAYQNDDGGLGHALEPDVRCPDSQPLFVTFGLAALAVVDGRDDDLLTGCCEFLETVADEPGAVPIILPSAADYPRADHWNNARRPPSLQATIGIAASLHMLGFSHPWLLERAAAAVPGAADLRTDPAATDYGLTPVQMVPTAVRARELFAADLLDAHLDALERAQCDDGGWPLDWDPPTAAARLAWRGQRTLEALRILRAYDRLPPNA
jgi:hypothetical protein